MKGTYISHLSRATVLHSKFIVVQCKEQDDACI